MRRYIIACVIWFGIFVGLISFVGLSLAQTSFVDWGEAENISQTGGTNSPVFFQSSSGEYHLFWQDVVEDRYNYVVGAPDAWSPSISVTVPFTQVTPLLIADTNNRVHAFWLDSEDEFLLYSRAFITSMVNYEGWSPPQTLADTAVDLDVKVDDSGNVHLLYVDVEESENKQAGVYYRRLDAGLPDWFDPVPLYTSSYMRGLEPDEANAELEILRKDGRINLVAGYDNRSRKRIFLSQSSNGGVNWGEPVEIAGPESGSSVVLPFDIKIGLTNDQLILVWSNGQPGVNCQQFTQVSDDLGETWSDRSSMANLFVGSQGCVIENQFLPGNDLTYLLSDTSGQSYLWAWDGEHWSEPELQEPLSYFENPETLNAVVLRCQQPIVSPDDLLVVAGCEGNVGGYNDGDIWLISRPLGGRDVWFPPATNWTKPALVDEQSDPYYSPILVPGAEEGFMAIWVNNSVSGNARPQMFNARFEEDTWLLPEEIFRPAAKLDSDLSSALGLAGNLYLSWGDALGQIYLATNLISDAHVASTWPEPAVVPGLGDFASYPDLAINKDNVLYMVYSVMVNDNRGVYIVSSTDRGLSWTEPIQIFDAAAAGWEIVGPAHLAVTVDNQIQVLLAQQTLLGDDVPQTKALYFTNSLDGGQTFTEAKMVAEGDIVWSELVASDMQTSHRLWQIWDGREYSLFHAYSGDGGQLWSEQTIVDVDMVSGPLTVAGNGAGALYLMEMTDTAVNEWGWQNQQWIPQNGFNLKSDSITNPQLLSLAGTVSHVGRLGALFTGVQESTDDEGNVSLRYNLQAASRVVDTSASISNTVPVVIEPPANATPTPEAEEPTDEMSEAELEEDVNVLEDGEVLTDTESLVEASSEPTATPVITNASNGEDANGDGNIILDIILALGPLLVLVGIVLLISLYRGYLRR